MNTHPNLTQIELERIAVFNRIRTIQSNNLTTIGHYPQFLISPAIAADGTAARQFDRNRKPHDEPEAWPVLAEVVAGVRCQYYCHRHDLPDGTHEYTLGCRVVWNNEDWRYEERNGKSDGWQQMIEDVL